MIKISTKNNKKNMDKNSKISYHSYKMKKFENERQSDNKKDSKNKEKIKILKSSQDKKKEKIRLREEKKIKKENLKLDRKKKRQYLKNTIIKNIKSDVFIIILGIALIILMLSLITFRQSTIANIKYSINKKNTDIHNIDNEIRVEMLKIDEASRSDVIEQKAIENLGMQYRNHQQIEYIMVD